MPKRGRQLFVGIVEDDPGVRAAVESLLNSADFATRSFSSAEEFLKSPPALNAACLVLDVELPGMSGLALQRELLRIGCRIPTIFMTASDPALRRIRRQASAQGALAVLCKPLDDSHLLNLIETAFSQHLRR